MKLIKPMSWIFLLIQCGAGVVLANGACKEDIQKYCKDVPRGEGRIIRCMKQHEAALSPECKAQIEKGKERRESRRKEKRSEHQGM